MYDTTAVTSTSGLYWWLTADSLSLNDGDTVASWTDLSGQGNTVTATNNPVFKADQINTLPCVRLSGSNYLKNASPSTSANLTSGTWFVVYRNPGLATSPTCLISNESGTKSQWNLAIGDRPADVTFTSSPSGWLFITDGDSRGRPGHWAAGEVFVPPASSGNWMIRSERSAGSGHSFFLNGSILGSSNAVGTDSSLALVSGWGGTLGVGYAPQTISSTYSTGGAADIAEIICYNQEISDSNMGDIHAYLKNKYFNNASSPINLSVAGAANPTSISGSLPTIVGGIGYDPSIMTATSGLYAWYAADSLSYNNGDNITSWKDLSGSGNTLTCSTSYPTFGTNSINNFPSVNFRGNIGPLTAGSFGIPAVGSVCDEGTWFFVYKSYPSGSYRQPLLSNDNVANGTCQWGITVNGDHNLSLNPSGWMFVTDNSFNGDEGSPAFGEISIPSGIASNWLIRTDVANRSPFHTFYLNGAIAGSSNAVGVTSTMTMDKTYGTIIRINGCEVSTAPLWADIAEIACYSRALNPTEISNVNSYLTAKYFGTSTSSSGSLNLSMTGGLQTSSGTLPLYTTNAAAPPSEPLDYFSGAEVFRYLSGNQVPASLDYFYGAEVYRGFSKQSTTPTTSSASGNMGLYIAGKNNSTSSINIYTGGLGSGSGYFPIYTGGKNNSTNSMNLYAGGFESGSGFSPIYIGGKSSISNSLGLSVLSTISLTNSVYLSTLNLGGASGSLPAYLCGNSSVSGNLPLFMVSYGNNNNNIPLYMSGATSYSGGIPLVVRSLNNASSGVDLSTVSFAASNNSIPLTISSLGQSSSGVNLTVNGANYSTSAFPLSVLSFLGSSGDLNLATTAWDTWGNDILMYIPNITNYSGSMPLYTQASYPPETASIPLATSGLGLSHSNIIMNVIGNGPKTKTNSANLSIYSSMPPKQSIYLSAPLNIRGTSMQVSMNMAISGSGQSSVGNTATLVLKTRELIEPAASAMPLMVNNDVKEINKYVKMVVAGDGSLDGGSVIHDSIGLYIHRALCGVCWLSVDGNDTTSSSLSLYSRGGIADNIPLYIGGLTGSSFKSINTYVSAATATSGNIPLYSYSDGTINSTTAADLYTRGF